MAEKELKGVATPHTMFLLAVAILELLLLALRFCATGFEFTVSPGIKRTNAPLQQPRKQQK